MRHSNLNVTAKYLIEAHDGFSNHDGCLDWLRHQNLTKPFRSFDSPSNLFQFAVNDVLFYHS